jgi:hypothetical protein
MTEKNLSIEELIKNLVEKIIEHNKKPWFQRVKKINIHDKL